MTEQSEPRPRPTNKVEFLTISLVQYSGLLDNLLNEKKHFLKQVKEINKQIEYYKKEMGFIKEIIRDYRGVLKKNG